MGAGQKLRGLVGQGLSGRKSYREVRAAVVGFADSSSGSNAIVTQVQCQALLYAFGPGAAGEQGVATGGGGGGGAACFRRIRLGANQTISWSLGIAGVAPGGAGLPGGDATDTTITIPGYTIRAGGGKGGGGVSAGVGGAGGGASGGDINRNGGAGGSGGSAGLSGSLGGGIGGSTDGSHGGGGGGAGFGDDYFAFAGGAGTAGGNGVAATGGVTGGGSGATGSGAINGSGALGRVYITLLRLS